MITVHRRLSTQWIKLGDDEEAEFLIQPLNSAAMIDVQNDVEWDAELDAIRMSGRGLLEACRAGLADWKGVKDEKGEDLPFKKAHIEWLPPDCLQRLAAKIIAASALGEEERKNS